MWRIFVEIILLIFEISFWRSTICFSIYNNNVQNTGKLTFVLIILDGDGNLQQHLELYYIRLCQHKKVDEEEKG